MGAAETRRDRARIRRAPGGVRRPHGGAGGGPAEGAPRTEVVRAKDGSFGHPETGEEARELRARTEEGYYRLHEEYVERFVEYLNKKGKATNDI